MCINISGFIFALALTISVIQNRFMKEIIGVRDVERKIEKKKLETIENTILLVEKIFSGIRAEIILSADGVDSDWDKNANIFLLNTESEQKIGMLILENSTSFGDYENEIVKIISKNLVRELGTLDELREVGIEEFNQGKELERCNLELSLAYEDLSLAHEELSEAYNMTVLLNKNLSRASLKVKSFLEQAPIAFGILRHRHLKVELANSLILQLWGKDKSVIGKPLSEALPELSGQPYLQILDDVYTSGVRYVGREAKVTLTNQLKTSDFYFNFIYEPLKNERGITNAIMIIATDVTELVNNRNTITKAIKNLNQP
ncbi:PAS domain-containing protein [Pedobacter paludis]|nr:PAS domain-containing protein [Pedobacter paludis]